MRDNGFIEKKPIPIKMEAWLPYLACPECKGVLHFEASFLICDRCKKEYQINHGIPLLLPDALKNISQSEEKSWLQVHTELEKKYIDLDGDSFRQKMRDVAKASHCSDIQDSFLWEKRLFRNLKDPAVLKKDFQRMLQERNKHILFKIKDRLNLKNKVVLNVGPGSDIDMINLLENEGAEVMNCELIEDSLYYLSNNGKELLTAGDIRSLPFQPGTFDLVLVIEVIHHVHPITVPLKEVYRVLKEGGIVCISELNRFNLVTLWIKMLPRFVRKWQRTLLRRIFKTDSRLGIGSPFERILYSTEVINALKEVGFLGIKCSVLEYVYPVYFPRLLINFSDFIAHRFPRVFTPLAFRYFYTAWK